LKTPLSHPTTDREVTVLAQELDERLKENKTKAYGLCFEREKYYL
jgi:hypothetical protein